MSRTYTLWMLCHDCGYEWRAEFYANGIDKGINVDSAGEECIECSSNNIEDTAEYREPWL